MKKLFLLLVAVLTLSLCASAQTRTVKGTVLDAENDEPLIGVSVTAGGNYGVSTDADGNFVLQVPATASKLTVSYVGYQTQQVNISDKPMVIRLAADNALLDPVIVVAYGEQKKSSFTGSAATVGAATIEKTQVTNVLDALSGKVAGLQLSNTSGAPGAGSPTIRIRGFSSTQAGNSPLVIVDGTPFTGDINSLNTNDIESMSVLKDAASNALYGARGANGVILITTKRAKLGDVQVIVDAKWGANTRASVDYDFIRDPSQYYELYSRSLYNLAVAPAGVDGVSFQTGMGYSPAAATQWVNNVITGDSGYGLGYNIFTLPEGQYLIGANGKVNPNATVGRMVNYNGRDFWVQPDNWMDNTYKSSLRQEYNVSISQGTDKSNLIVAANYLNNEGIIYAPSSFERFTGRIRGEIQAKSWLKAGINASYSHTKTEAMSSEEGSSASTGNVFAIATRIAPIYPMFMRDGNKNIMVDAQNFPRYDYGAGLNAGMTRPYLTGANAMSDARLNKRESDGNALTATAFVEVRFLNDFKFTTNNNINFMESRGTSMNNPYYGQYAPQNGTLTKSHVRNVDYTFQQLLNWNHTFGSVHNVSALLGHEWFKTTYYALAAGKSNLFLPSNDELAGAIVDSQSANSYTTMYNVEGWFGRAQYDYDSKYFASVSYRRDASSRFHPDHRWGNFWSAGAAWILSKEEFFNADWVNLLKIKASYGEQGNDNIPNYLYTDQFSLVNSNGMPALTPGSNKGNPNISWEKGGNLNGGVEFELFNTRLNGSVEAFYRKTTDMLAFFPLPQSSGHWGYYSNVGDMTNTGVEIELQGVPVRTKDFTWSINLNFTWYKNRISRLPDVSKRNTVDGVEGYSDGNYFYGEGKSMYTFYMPKYAGVGEDGQALYYTDAVDADGKPLVTSSDYSVATQHLCGSALAPVYGGFTTNFEYKGFDLSASFNYQIGGQVYDSGYAALMSSPTSSGGTNFHADLFNAWTPENKGSNIPRFRYGDLYSTSTSDRFLTNASYLSLENINFGYTLPQNIVKKMYLNKLRVYFAADNIWVWSKRQGLDPRQSFTGGSNNTYYSPIRTLSGGLTVTF